jgi:hypothetical protein
MRVGSSADPSLAVASMASDLSANATKASAQVSVMKKAMKQNEESALQLLASVPGLGQKIDVKA